MENDRAIVLVVEMQEYRQDGDRLRVNLPELDMQVVQEEVKLHVARDSCRMCFPSDILGGVATRIFG